MKRSPLRPVARLVVLSLAAASVTSSAGAGAPAPPRPAPLAARAGGPPATWPSPWEAGEDAHLVDVDEDGAADVLVLGEEGGREFAWFVDVDGEAARSAPRDPERIFRARRFPAAAVLLADDDTVLGWYDTAGRGTFDLALVGDADTGAVRRAFRLGPGKAPTALPREAFPRTVADPGIFGAGARARRFDALARAVVGIWSPGEGAPAPRRAR